MSRFSRPPRAAALQRWNPAVGILNLAVQSLTFGLISPLVLHYLGPEAFGVWALGSTLLAFATLLDLGLGEAAAQKVGSLGGARADTATIHHVLREVEAIYRRTSLIGLACAPLVALGLLQVVRVDELPSSHVYLFWLAAAASFFVGLPSYSRSAIHAGRGEAWAQRIPLIAESMTTLILTPVVIVLGGDLVVVGAVLVLSRLTGAVVRRELFRHVAQAGGFWPVARDKGTTRLISLRRAALPFLIMAVATRFTLSSGSVFIGAFVDASAVGPYFFAFRVFYTIPLVAWQFTDYLFPIYGRLIASERTEEARRLTARSLDFTQLLVAVFASITALVYNPLVSIVDQRLKVSVSLLAAFIVLTLLQHASHVLIMGANGGGAQQAVVRWVVVDAVASFALGIPLVIAKGPIGVLLAICLSNAVILYPGLVWEWKRLLGDGGFPWWPLRASLPGALISLAAVATLFLAPSRGQVLGAVVLATATLACLIPITRTLRALTRETRAGLAHVTTSDASVSSELLP